MYALTLLCLLIAFVFYQETTVKKSSSVLPIHSKSFSLHPYLWLLLRPTSRQRVSNERAFHRHHIHVFVSVHILQSEQQCCDLVTCLPSMDTKTRSSLCYKTTHFFKSQLKYLKQRLALLSFVFQVCLFAWIKTTFYLEKSVETTNYSNSLSNDTNNFHRNEKSAHSVCTFSTVTARKCCQISLNFKDPFFPSFFLPVFRETPLQHAFQYSHKYGNSCISQRISTTLFCLVSIFLSMLIFFKNLYSFAISSCDTTIICYMLKFMEERERERESQAHEWNCCDRVELGE